MTKEQEGEKQLKRLWKNLGDIPVTEGGVIEQSFYIWDAGTDREEIWHWFDDEYNRLNTGKNWFDIIK